MLWVADTLVILLLALLGFAAADGLAMPTVLWSAFVTPALVQGDVRSRRLPNTLTLPAVGLVGVCSGSAMVAGLVSGSVAQDPTWSLAAALVTAGAGRLVARAAVVGMGDVKLATALVGSLVLACGEGSLWTFAAVVSCTGAVLALRRNRRIGAERGVPYGPCLLLGYWSTLGLYALT